MDPTIQYFYYTLQDADYTLTNAAIDNAALFLLRDHIKQVIDTAGGTLMPSLNGVAWSIAQLLQFLHETEVLSNIGPPAGVVNVLNRDVNALTPDDLLHLIFPETDPATTIRADLASYASRTDLIRLLSPLAREEGALAELDSSTDQELLDLADGLYELLNIRSLLDTTDWDTMVANAVVNTPPFEHATMQQSDLYRGFLQQRGLAFNTASLAKLRQSLSEAEMKEIYTAYVAEQLPALTVMQRLVEWECFRRAIYE